jgi:membrane fusion protein (multidrug efflux system)
VLEGRDVAQQSGSGMRAFSCFLGGIAFVMLGLVYPAHAQAPADAPPPAVTVAVVGIGDAAGRAEFIGRLEAVQAVDARARVEGFIKAVNFKEGQDVKAGELLFQIEPDQYAAALAKAEAQVDSAEATLRNAELNYERRRDLAARGTVSRADLDTALAQRDTAKAELAAAKAGVEAAQLEVNYTKITSPIAGRIGRTNFTVGNLVGPSSGVLARIVQLDPIRAVFSVSERDVLDVKAQEQKASQQQINAGFVPTLRLANGEVYAETGKIEFLGNEIDPATGTVPIRALFPNPQKLLLPGGTVFVQIRPAQSKSLPVVPVSAVQETRQGKSVLVVNAENRVEERAIKAETQVGQNWAVEEGLKPGERIIVEGLQKVRPGQIVRPIPAAPTSASK